ncbi:hypothetical protein ACJJIF_19075 [Microbulbifer sp. SSSA002]|uniref:hypothetical protein n=1 Tax=Microbulbifer sp. SSSA002 TaxID=3243376 RepID=UPI00403A19A4
MARVNLGKAKDWNDNINKLKTPKWSVPRRLEPENFLGLKDKFYVYEIGFIVSGAVVQQSFAPEEIHGREYPKAFIPMFVGKDQGRGCCGIADCYYPANSNCNENIRDYLEVYRDIAGGYFGLAGYGFLKYGLYFTYIPLKNPAHFEALKRLGMFYYPWNDFDEQRVRREALMAEDLNGSEDFFSTVKEVYQGDTWMLYPNRCPSELPVNFFGENHGGVSAPPRLTGSYLTGAPITAELISGAVASLVSQVNQFKAELEGFGAKMGVRQKVVSPRDKVAKMRAGVKLSAAKVEVAKIRAEPKSTVPRVEMAKMRAGSRLTIQKNKMAKMRSKPELTKK